MKYATAITAALVAGATASFTPGYAPGYEGEKPEESSAPSYEAPSAPAYEAPSAPAYEAPSAPAYEAPSAPAYETPSKPSYAAPSKSYEAPSWVTEVLTAYTTYCPESTEITHGGTTYSVTEATTLTITGPVTVTYPVTVSTYSSCTACTEAPPPPPTTYAPPPPPMGTAPPVYSVPSNGTVPKPSGTAPGVSTPAGPTPTFTGAASALKAGSAGIAALFGLVAYAL